MILKNKNYLLVPVVIIFLVYCYSLTFGFRNFDEDVIIKDFYTNKTFAEYLEKYLLTSVSGITSAHGFAFSSIQNIHFCPLERPLFYLVNYLFKANPFLFHVWGLILHITVSIFIGLFSFNLTNSKNISLFSTLIWGIHPINTEAVIWATNWPALVGAALYFGTLYFLSKKLNQNTSLSKGCITLISILTLVQVLIVEHCITLPLIIFLIVFYFSKQNSLTNSLKITLFPFIIIIAYLLIRMFLADKGLATSTSNITDIFQRIVYLTPQVFIHNLKLLAFPITLSIDQIDHLHLDEKLLGIYNLFSIIVFLFFFTTGFLLKRKAPLLSFCIFAYIIAISPFLQIIPLYSVVAERYSYFGSYFLILGLAMLIQILLQNKNKLIISILVLLSFSYGIRTLIRMQDWRNSQTLFLSTINTSQSLYKKGIWTYNLALSSSKSNEKELLLLSNNLLKIFAENYEESNSNPVLNQYELDGKSLKAKAYLRLAKINDLIGNSDLALNYLNEALKNSNPKSKIQAEIYSTIATNHFQNNNYIKAIELYKKSNHISSNPTTEYAIAICYLKLNDFENYEKYLQKATSIISLKNTKPFTTYGQFLELSKGDYKNAIKNYKIATLLEDKPEPYILLSTLYIKQNDLKNAEKYIKRGLHSFKTDPFLTYLNGSLLIGKGKTSQGIKELEKVLRMEEASNDIKIEAGNILVSIFLSKNDHENAKKYNDIVLMIR